MSDTIVVAPWNFDKKLDIAIRNKLNYKFANKVVHNLGLCICLFDILEIGDSYVLPGDGSSHTKVKFRFVIFHPYIDEIIIGKVKSSSSEGLTVTLGFFDDVVISKDNIIQPSKFDEKEQLWVWLYSADDPDNSEEEIVHNFFIDINQQIRFRVIGETFTDTTPAGPQLSNIDASLQIPSYTQTPYSISGSITDPGLGLLQWWTG